MKKALLANDYPYIIIRIKEIDLKENQLNSDLNSWSEIQALAQITIAGKTRQVNMDIAVSKQEENKFQFISVIPLLMTDFGINPPKVLNGLIAVDDQIEVNLDLVVGFE